jgi:ribosomal-protein-alanine N-acetyltransferase
MLPESRVASSLIRSLSTGDAKWLAELHALCFDEAQCWSADLFRSMLSQMPVTGLVLITAYEPVAFLIARRVLDEGEILTLAVHPSQRRRGHARALIDAYLGEQKHKGAVRLFLEVAVNNQPAIELYKKMDFSIVSTRKEYYEQPKDKGDAKLDGYVMAKNIV